MGNEFQPREAGHFYLMLSEILRWVKIGGQELTSKKSVLTLFFA